MFLYLVKYSHPDIVNPVRELSKALNGTIANAYKEMLRIIKFILDTRGIGLRIWSTGNLGDSWYMVCFIYSDFVTDPVDHK